MPTKSSQKDKKKNKKLTEFFVQKPSLSVLPPATSSSSEKAMTASAPCQRRPATRASTAAADHECSMNFSAPLQTRSTSRKRARSPDSNDPSASITQPSRQSTQTSKSETPSKRLRPVVYLNSPLPSRNSPARKQTFSQAHKGPLVSSPSDSSKQVVCSSQSDEEELVLPIPERRDFGKVVEGIRTWRQHTSEFSPPSSPCAREDAMEVDTPPSSPTRCSPDATPEPETTSPHFGAPVRFVVTPECNTAPHTPIITSIVNELPPLPPTPKPLGPEAKTAKLIAEIKARAYAAHRSSDDEQHLEFRELDDSDDGEIIDDLPLISNAREPNSPPRAPHGVFSSPLSSVPSTFNDVNIVPRCGSPDPGSSSTGPARMSARIRKPAPTFHLPITVAESSNSVGATRLKSLPPNRKKSHTTNPLRALLREKELEERRGTSGASLRLAEEAVKRAAMASEDEISLEGNLRLTDEQAAWKAVRESRKSTSPSRGDDSEIFAIGDRESKMLGADGAAINKILASNKESKGKEGALNADQKRTWGVPLWIRPSDEDMEVDRDSTPSLLAGHPILTYMETLRESCDDSTLDLILRTGALATVPTDILSSNIPQLLHMSLFASPQMADAISVALRHLWRLNPQKFQMPFAAILSALVRLGASPTILTEYGFNLECSQRSYSTPTNLLDLLKKILSIVKAAGFAGALPSDDIACVVLILVILGLDPSISSELYAQLNITLDVVCNHAATDFLLPDIHERVLRFARQLAPVNKARLVSLFASGSGRTIWTAQRLAYSLLVSSVPDNANELPLDPLILLLSPDASSGELFDVSDESTDYEELRHYVDILSVALNDITPYIEEERIAMKTVNSTSAQRSPGKQKPVFPLELLRKVLDTLQGKIVDTRAAHLDRSRTKAAIQRLTMRIHYDRMALIRARPGQRSSTLKAYFSPQRP